MKGHTYQQQLLGIFSVFGSSLADIPGGGVWRSEGQDLLQGVATGQDPGDQAWGRTLQTMGSRVDGPEGPGSGAQCGAGP